MGRRKINDKLTQIKIGVRESDVMKLTESNTVNSDSRYELSLLFKKYLKKLFELKD